MRTPRVPRKQPSVRVCISWTRIFVLLLLFYAILALVFVLQIQDGPAEQLLLQRLHWKAPSAVVTPSLQDVEYDNAMRLKPSVEDKLKEAIVPASTSRSSNNNNNNIIIYYNPFHRDRYICGKHLIPAKGILELPLDCYLEPSKLYLQIPNATNMPPIVTRFGHGIPKDFGCDVPCQTVGKPSIVSKRTIDGTNWTITFSMEGPDYYSQLKIDPIAYQRDQYYSTTSFQSDIPLPYYSWAEYNITTPPIHYPTVQHAAVFLARNCQSRNHRERIVKELSNYFRVDSLSTCLHNAEPPAGVNLKNKQNVMQHYLFYLAFENQNVDDYITEKLWGPLQAGTVPVYFGAPNVKNHVPEHSMIDVREFTTVQALGEHLQAVANSNKLYQAYHAWRSKPLPARFHRKYDMTHSHSTCRTCRWAYAKLYGMGWNQESQSMYDADIEFPRKACLEHGRLLSPVLEQWIPSSISATSTSDRLVGPSTCELNDHNRVLELSSVRRTLWPKDGVLDIHVQQPTQTWTWRLDTHLQNASFQQVAPGHYRMQEKHKRFTFLVRPAGIVLVRDRSAVQIVCSQSLWLRIIVEQVDTFHQGAKDLDNYFGRLMMDDFLHPVVAYVRANG